jgi:hypothetical protein
MKKPAYDPNFYNRTTKTTKPGKIVAEMNTLFQKYTVEPRLRNVSATALLAKAKEEAELEIEEAKFKAAAPEWMVGRHRITANRLRQQYNYYYSTPDEIVELEGFPKLSDYQVATIGRLLNKLNLEGENHPYAGERGLINAQIQRYEDGTLYLPAAPLIVELIRDELRSSTEWLQIGRVWGGKTSFYGGNEKFGEALLWLHKEDAIGFTGKWAHNMDPEIDLMDGDNLEAFLAWIQDSGEFPLYKKEK